jgi:hypothetical protein
MSDKIVSPSTKLLFSNVPVDCQDEYLRLWVEARGYRVSSLKLIRDSVSGTSTSFAYVQLMNPSRLDEAARSLDGQTIRGLRIQVARVESFF